MTRVQRPQVKPKNTQIDEEVDERDDKIIARALRWSLVALLLIGAGVGGGIYWFNRKPIVQLPKGKPLVMPAMRDRVAAELPQIPFANITESAGIKFVHENGAEGEKLLPETMGGGCAFLDFDNDGNQDLLLVNSSSWPWAKNPKEFLRNGRGHRRFR